MQRHGREERRPPELTVKHRVTFYHNGNERIDFADVVWLFNHREIPLIQGTWIGRIDQFITSWSDELTDEQEGVRGEQSGVALKENLVRLSLDDIHELFVDQPLDIYSDNEWDYMGESVLDRIIEHMTPGFIDQRDPLRLVIVLPPEKIVPDITPRTEIAIRRWARQKIEDNHVKIRIGRRFGYHGLIPGFLFLATCVVLSKFTLDGLGPYVGPVLAFIFAEGVLIVGVVALETPVRAILYNHLPYQREIECSRS